MNMKRNLISLAVASAIVGAAGFAPAPAFAQNAEIEALKAQLAALSSKIEALEKSQTQTKKTVEETQATADKTADVVAQEKSRLSFSGDVRYRNESFDVEHVDRDRNRDRIRARLNANFRVNDTVTGVLGLATGALDPRSANQTLTDQNARKEIQLDLAYVTWAPTASSKLTFGKQREPWLKTPSYFYDNDVNVEGMSYNYASGNFFGAAWYDWLSERALSFSNVTTGTNTDTIMVGGQLGYRIPFSDSVKLTVAGSYFSFDGVQGYNPFFGGSSFGNSTTTSAAVCNRSLGAGVACSLSDFEIIQLFGDLTATVAGRPLRFFVDYAQNTEAEEVVVNGNAADGLEKLDTALSGGFSYGVASAAKGTWEFGAMYQKVEKDALFGQLLDSDFGDGNTDTDGIVLRGGYTVARNWTINASLFLNSLSNDVPQSVTVFNENTPAPYDTTVITGIQDRDYKRLQLDLNFRF